MSQFDEDGTEYLPGSRKADEAALDSELDDEEAALDSEIDVDEDEAALDSEIDFDDETDDDQLPLDELEAREAGVNLDDPERLPDE